MYNRDLIGKTLEEAETLLQNVGAEFSVEQDISNKDWDTELVVRITYDGAYRLITSRFKLKPESEGTLTDG